MPDASHDFGAHLKQAREQRGISLRAIAEHTKISVLALEALERNDMSRLPGGIFTRAFVRAYAGEVGLDPEDTVRRFLARFPADATEEPPSVREPSAGHIEVEDGPAFGRGWRAVVWAIPLLLGVAYFGFGGRLPFWGDGGAPATGKPADVQRPSTPPPPETAAAGPSQQTAGTGAGAVTVPPGQPAEEAGTEAADANAAPPAAEPQAAAPAPAEGAAVGETPAGETAPVGAGAFRLTLATREACWVSVRIDGTSVFSGLMQPGERKNLALHGRASVTVGNAGAVDYLLNDQPGRPLGATGQVATVVISADNLNTLLAPR